MCVLCLGLDYIVLLGAGFTSPAPPTVSGTVPGTQEVSDNEALIDLEPLGAGSVDWGQDPLSLLFVGSSPHVHPREGGHGLCL